MVLYGIEEKAKKFRSIFKIALPLMIQGLVFQLQALTDKAFLGNLDTRYISAAGAAQMPYSATADSLVAINIGLVIIVSRFFGAGEKEKISSYVKSTVFYSSLLAIGICLIWQCKTGVILGLFQIDQEIIGYSIQYVKIVSVYLLFLGADSSLQAMLQGSGETKPIMYAGILKVGLDILLSWILIFGKFGFPALYVSGAAIGTLIANLVSFLYILCYCMILHRKKYHLNIFSKAWVQVKPYKDTIRLGLPVGMEYLLWNASNLILIRFINGFSYRDMAIYTLTFGFQCIVYMIFESTSKATMTLIGQSIGAGRRERVNGYFYTAILINLIIVGTAAVCFSFFPERLLGIFSNDSQVIRYGVPYLMWMGIIMFPQSMNVICGNAIRAHGDTKWMLFSQIFGSVLVISVSWILVEKVHMNMLAIYVTLFADEAIRGGVNFIYYRRKYGRAVLCR